MSEAGGTALASMSCGQLQVVRKLALVTLTGCMERYCPTHRSGWNWELPKFIKKIKTPDYKGEQMSAAISTRCSHNQLYFFLSRTHADKKIFGVPLVLLLQRTGQAIPLPIQAAIKWLKLHAVDQVIRIYSPFARGRPLSCVSLALAGGNIP